MTFINRIVHVIIPSATKQILTEYSQNAKDINTEAYIHLDTRTSTQYVAV